MKITKKLFVAIFFSTTLVACGGNKSADNERVEGENISNNPIKVFNQVKEAGKKFEQAQAQISEKEPVDPIHFRELITLLPEAPQGWNAEEAEGETNSFGGYSISQASRSYTKGDRSIEVTITDWAYNTALYASFLVGADFSQESSQGYNKGIKIGDTPGREEYDYKSKDGKLTLLAEQRFFIEIDGDNIESEDLQQWWDAMDKKGLSKKASSK